MLDIAGALAPVVAPKVIVQFGPSGPLARVKLSDAASDGLSDKKLRLPNTSAQTVSLKCPFVILAVRIGIIDEVPTGH